MDPLFSNLRGLRSTGAEIMDQQLEDSAPTEEEAQQLFAELENHTFFLDKTNLADLEAELVAQASPENPGCFALEFTARPSGARYCPFIGVTDPALEPTSNHIQVEIPFAESSATDEDLITSILDASIEAWAPRTCGIYGVWHDPNNSYDSHSVYWLHWKAAGVTRDNWKNAKGQPVTRNWPIDTPTESRPHLGGILDVFPRHRPDLLATYVTENRPPD